MSDLDRTARFREKSPVPASWLNAPRSHEQATVHHHNPDSDEPVVRGSVRMHRLFFSRNSANKSSERCLSRQIRPKGAACCFRRFGRTSTSRDQSHLWGVEFQNRELDYLPVAVLVTSSPRSINPCSQWRSLGCVAGELRIPFSSPVPRTSGTDGCSSAVPSAATHRAPSRKTATANFIYLLQDHDCPSNELS